MALILLLRPLDYKAAQGLPRLHADPSLRLSHLLPPQSSEGETGRTKGIVEEHSVTTATMTGDSALPLWFMFHSAFVAVR